MRTLIYFNRRLHKLHKRMFGLNKKRQIYRQFIKYLSVGGITNLLAYILYLVVVLLGVNLLVSMTFVYVVAAGSSFVANKAWTFKSAVPTGAALAKYVLVQLLGYITSLLLLAGLYYGVGLPHYIAQPIAMGIVALELFLLSRYFVFL